MKPVAVLILIAFGAFWLLGMQADDSWQWINPEISHQQAETVRLENVARENAITNDARVADLEYQEAVKRENAITNAVIAKVEADTETYIIQQEDSLRQSQRINTILLDAAQILVWGLGAIVIAMALGIVIVLSYAGIRWSNTKFVLTSDLNAVPLLADPDYAALTPVAAMVDNDHWASAKLRPHQSGASRRWRDFNSSD